MNQKLSAKARPRSRGKRNSVLSLSPSHARACTHTDSASMNSPVILLARCPHHPVGAWGRLLVVAAVPRPPISSVVIHGIRSQPLRTPNVFCAHPGSCHALRRAALPLLLLAATAAPLLAARLLRALKRTVLQRWLLRHRTLWLLLLLCCGQLWLHLPPRGHCTQRHECLIGCERGLGERLPPVYGQPRACDLCGYNNARLHFRRQMKMLERKAPKPVWGLKSS